MNNLNHSEKLLESIVKSYFFLQNSKKIKDALQKIIEILGKSCKVDRVYIFKNHMSKEGVLKMNYILEWTAEDVIPILGDPLLKDLPWNLFPEIHAKLSKNISINDLVRKSNNQPFKEAMMTQGILAFLFVPIFVGRVFWGYIGFDNCKTEKLFPNNEISTLHALAITIGITLNNRRQKRKILKDNKNFISVLNSISETVLKLDSNGRITFLNNNWPNLTGYQIKQSLNHDLTVFFHKKYREKINEILAELKSGDTCTSHINTELITNNGHLVWVTLRLSLMITNDNAPQVIVGSITNIQEEIRNGIEAKKLNELLQVVNESQLIFFEHEDFNIPIQKVLSSLLKISQSEFGFMGEVLIDENGDSFLQPHTSAIISLSEETQKLFEQYFKPEKEFGNLNTLFGESLRTGKAVIANDCTMDVRIGRISNSYPPIRNFLSIPIYKSNELIGLIGIANKRTNYSEKDIKFLEPIISGYANFIKAVQINRKKKETEAMYKLLSENSGDIVALHDLDLRFKYVSPSFEKLLGYSPKEVIGKHPAQLFKNQPLKVEKYNGFEKLVISHRHKKNKNEIILEILRKELKNEYNKPIAIVATSRDVTEREKLLQKLKDSLVKEKDMNKLKSRFISMTSHEFRTPIATIISSVELMQLLIGKIENDENIEKLKTHLIRVNAQTRRLTKIISDVLILEQNNQGKNYIRTEPIFISKFIYSLVDDNFTKSNKRLIYLNLPTEDKLIKSDPSWLDYILRNIIENAIKYSENSIKPPKLTLKYTKAYFYITVEDYGIGIPKEDKKYIFSSFFRARNVVNIKGTGLGLNIVKDFVEKLGGSITFKSQEGEGSKFSLKLPYEK